MSLIKNFVVRRQTPFYFPLIPFEKTVTVTVVVVVLKGEKGEEEEKGSAFWLFAIILSFLSTCRV